MLSTRLGADTSSWDFLSAHDTPDVNEWFDEHPRWTRHFTPKHASWLNQIECWFLDRHVLARGSFSSTDDLATKIDAYVAWYPRHGSPLLLVLPSEVLAASDAAIGSLTLTLTWSWTLT